MAVTYTCDICTKGLGSEFNKITLRLYNSIQHNSLEVPDYDYLCFECFRYLREILEKGIEKLKENTEK